ncbi:MAG: leucine-rich repeat domain-containing protein [Candidatus Saccharimonadales bacterium]
MSTSTNIFGVDKLLQAIRISLFVGGCAIVSGLAIGSTPAYAATPADACFTRTAGTITGYTVGGVDNCPTNVDIPTTIGGVTITAIGNNSFLSKGLTALTIPSTVTNIGQSSFQNNQLTAVTIPSSVTIIGASAFRGNQLTSITIPSSVTNIGSNAVRDNLLTSFTVVGNPATIGNSILENNPQLATISYNGTSHTAPGSATQPADACFAFTVGTGTITDYYLNNLARIKSTGQACMARNVIIPSQIGVTNVLAIGASSFDGNSLTGIAIPSSVTTIGNTAFYSNLLTSLVIPNSVISIGSLAFSYNQLNSLTLSNSLTTIGVQAFAANQLTSLVIPNSVTSIGTSAFFSNNLTSVTLPNALTIINDYVFAYNQLPSVVIPDSVTSIGQEAFFNNQLNSVMLPNSLVSIGENAFSSNALSSLTLPSSLISIGNAAFRSNQLTSLIIPNSVTTIGFNAFESNQLTSVTLSNTLTNIASSIFRYNKLVSVTIPSSVTSIDDSAFEYQTGLGRELNTYDSDPSANQLAIDMIWYVKLYTADPSNPLGFTDTVYLDGTELDGQDSDYDEPFITGGYIVNPASATFNFVDDNGNTVASSTTLTGQETDGVYTNTYLASNGPTVPMPVDPYGITPTEQQAANDALSAYYRISEPLTYTAPTISGKLPTPASYSFVLGAADNANIRTFVYDDVPVGGALTPSQLAITGVSVWMMLIGVTVLLLGSGTLLARR